LPQSFRLRGAHIIIGLVTTRALLRKQRRSIRRRRYLLPRTSLQTNRRPKTKQQRKPQGRSVVTQRFKMPSGSHFLQSFAHLFCRPQFIVPQDIRSQYLDAEAAQPTAIAL
jgi:hypothetical protein